MRVRAWGGLAVLSLALVRAGANAAAQDAPKSPPIMATGSVEIVVVAADSVRLAGAQVILESAKRIGAVSDDSGFARMTDVAPGAQMLRVRRIGYDPLQVSVDVEAGRTSRLTVQLREAVLLGVPSKAEIEKAAAENSANGRVDSVGTRRVPLDTTERLGWQALGRDVLRTALLRTRGDSTIVFSPVSAGMAFGMVLAGARGGTAAELSHALGTDTLSSDDVGRRSARYLENVRARSDVTLNIANAAWWNPGFEESPAYRARVLREYGATIERRDLSTPEFVDALNEWAKEKTNGMIPKVLERPLPDTAVFLLANATYFNGKWLIPFDSSNTRRRDFMLRSGARRAVPMMERVARVSYVVRPGYRVARLPYLAGKAAMYLVLPDSGVTVDPAALPFIGSPTADSVAHAPMSELRIVVPRFTGSHEEDLVETMQSLGVHSLFDCGVADLQAMLRDKGTPLCVGMAKQTARIEVTEEGTKAAAVTLVGGITTTGAPPPPIPFVVNRPFFFVVRDEVYGVDLFIGYVAVPDGR